jgi:hypothetical protein
MNNRYRYSDTGININMKLFDEYHHEFYEKYNNEERSKGL